MSTVCGKRLLPPGYRFQPYDHELLKFYLFPRVHGSQEYPADVIRDMDVYCCQPSDIPSEDGANYSYFFTLRVRKFDKGSRLDRCTKDGKGYWRMTSGINEILDEVDGSVLGRKNTLVYFEKTRKEKGVGRKTNWIMHEYILDECLLPPSNDKANDIVVCRIHDHVGNNKRQRKINDQKKVAELSCSEQVSYNGTSISEPSSMGNEIAPFEQPVYKSDQSTNLPTFSEIAPVEQPVYECDHSTNLPTLSEDEEEIRMWMQTILESDHSNSLSHDDQVPCQDLEFPVSVEPNNEEIVEFATSSGENGSQQPQMSSDSAWEDEDQIRMWMETMPYDVQNPCQDLMEFPAPIEPNNEEIVEFATSSGENGSQQPQMSSDYALPENGSQQPQMSSDYALPENGSQQPQISSDYALPENVSQQPLMSSDSTREDEDQIRMWMETILQSDDSNSLPYDDQVPCEDLMESGEFPAYIEPNNEEIVEFASSSGGNGSQQPQMGSDCALLANGSQQPQMSSDYALLQNGRQQPLMSSDSAWEDEDYIRFEPDFMLPGSVTFADQEWNLGSVY